MGGDVHHETKRPGSVVAAFRAYSHGNLFPLSQFCTGLEPIGDLARHQGIGVRIRNGDSVEAPRHARVAQEILRYPGNTVAMPSASAQPPARLPIALTIAGSDPSGGAGIQADLKTFHQFGVYGQAVIALLTVQNTREVRRVQVMSPSLVADQLRAVLDDIPPAAAKTGALGNAEMIRTIARQAASFRFPLVVDPVMISKHGAPLLAPDAHQALRDELLPHCYLVTPNLHEAGAILGRDLETVAAMREAAEAIAALGPKSVLIKGGHLEGDALDILFTGGIVYEFPADRYDTPHTHGTGCTFSAAITACLARGLALPEAVEVSKRFITEAIRTNPGLGRGNGPVNHFADVSFLAEG